MPDQKKKRNQLIGPYGSEDSETNDCHSLVSATEALYLLTDLNSPHEIRNLGCTRLQVTEKMHEVATARRSSSKHTV
jgi:hypothetical protein